MPRQQPLQSAAITHAFEYGEKVINCLVIDLSLTKAAVKSLANTRG